MMILVSDFAYHGQERFFTFELTAVYCTASTRTNLMRSGACSVSGQNKTPKRAAHAGSHQIWATTRFHRSETSLRQGFGNLHIRSGNMYFYVKLLDTHLVFYSFIGYQEPQAQTTETTAHASCNARSRDAHCRRCQTAHIACAQLKGCILYCVEKRVE